jgi:hypothetical protein
MGSWNLASISGQATPFEQGALFGNNVICNFKLVYTPSMTGRFVEPPKLDWHEKFIMIEHHKRERWTFEKNMYEHNPTSNTLAVWPSRYIDAYDNAGGQALRDKGSSLLVDKAGQRVPATKLARVTDKADKADAVRDYLKGHGGALLITIHDIPSIQAPKQVAAPPVIGGHRGMIWERKERLLLFNCGVVGGGLRFRAMQYLDVDGSKPKPLWGREAPLAWARADLPLPRGYRDVPAPSTVSDPRPAQFLAGEVW